MMTALAIYDELQSIGEQAQRLEIRVRVPFSQPIQRSKSPLKDQVL